MDVNLMAMHPDRFSTLKLKMTQAEDVCEPIRYFFDHLADDPDFIDQSRPARHTLLESIIRQIGSRLVVGEGPAIMHRFAMLSIPKRQFYHGCCRINGKVAGFFYFEDIKTGCLGMVSSIDAPTDFVRFSASVVHDPRKMPSA